MFGSWQYIGKVFGMEMYNYLKKRKKIFSPCNGVYLC